ncbi:MAG: hypothetical protein KDC66_11165 [Phaeodactylibacter sp.]|nr:hypothetical protein [Phaeodactylibacter sp.]MCB9272899.1 hypothetical protein [Lewinellaceae bacterium]
MRQYLYTFLFFLPAATLLAQGAAQVDFGKNRVQYHRDFDEWSQYESENFITYWYGEGRFVGQAVVQLAEQDFNSIQNILEHRINEKIQIIVYTDLTDLKQSNIGSEEAFTNTGGQTKIVGNKVFVYFNGDHNDLRRQIREGIASVYLDAMLFGSNLQEIVQNAVMMNLPNWFKEGLVAYVGEPWNSNLDNQLRDYILNDEFEGFETLAEENPRLAGHSLWYFIGENYGRSTVSNLLYLTRINRSIESGFLYVLGSPYEMIGDSWALFFRQRYLAEGGNNRLPDGNPVEIKNKRKLPIGQLKLSPDGNRIIYTTNEIGKYRVYLQDIATGDRKVLLKGGFRNAFQATDYNYPLLAWNPSGQQVAILYEQRDVPKLLVYDLLNDKTIVEDLSTEYQRVYSMDYVNPITLVFSATVRGYSDIFLYYTNTRQTQRITNDFWDDLDASFVRVGDQNGIIFASNRQDSLLRNERLDSILPVNTYDLYYYGLENRSNELVRITHTPFANERQPAAVDTTWFSYLSDKNGVYNRQMGYLEDYIHHYEQLIRLHDGTDIRLHIDSTLESLDSSLIDTIIIEPIIKKRAITHANTDYSRGILSQSTAPRAGRVASLVLLNGKHQAFVRQMYPDSVATVSRTRYQNMREVMKAQDAQAIVKGKKEAPPVTTILKEADKVTAHETEIPVEKRDTGKVDIDNYLFQSEFDDEDVPPSVIVLENENEKKNDEQQPMAPAPGPATLNSSSAPRQIQGRYDFRSSKIIPYRLQFRTDYVTTQLDNSLLFDGLNSYASNPDGFNYPPPGILLKGNLKDLFEDYEFEGGVRIPTTFNGSEYFLIYKDKKKRLDKQYAIYRRNQRFSGESQTFVPNRREVNVVLGQASVRYPLDIFRSLRATGTLRRDRITQLSTDLPSLETPTTSEERLGLRLEYVFDNTLDVALNIKNGTRYKVFTEMVKRFDLELDNGASLNFNKGFMTIVGFDARHYQRVLKHSVLAARLAGATSFGSEKILYYLGGVDNWLFTSFNNEIPIPQNDEFAYQTIASNMRGFDLNIRNGNTYLLLNTELRMPVFKYLSKRIRSPFFRNFQLVGFFDLGSAWEGLDPFSKDNPLNTSIIPNGPLVSVKVNYFRDPVVAGYGFGARALLFGYMLRIDYGWGIETRQVQDPKLYVSLGMDF